MNIPNGSCPCGVSNSLLLFVVGSRLLGLGFSAYYNLFLSKNLASIGYLNPLFFSCKLTKSIKELIECAICNAFVPQILVDVIGKNLINNLVSVFNIFSIEFFKYFGTIFLDCLTLRSVHIVIAVY